MAFFERFAYFLTNLMFWAIFNANSVLFSFPRVSGNTSMIDRIRFNYVIDFIFFKFIKFPVFNIADIFVTLSVIVLVILFIFKYNDADHDIISFVGARETEIKQDREPERRSLSDAGRTSSEMGSERVQNIPTLIIE